MNKAYYFKSPNCVVCESLLPKIEAHIKSQYPLLEWQVIEVDRYPDTAAQFHVFTAPTLLVFFEGKEYFRWVRNFSVGEIDHRLKRVYDLMFD